MRTTVEENARMGEWIVGRLNRMEGPVRFLLPEGGVSALDAPGQPFQDTAADRALFDAIMRTFREAPNRRLVRLPHPITDQAFAETAVAAPIEHEKPGGQETCNAATQGRERHSAYNTGDV